MSNKKFIMKILATTIINTLKDIIINDICCMNCEYYYINTIMENGFCTIDKQDIPTDLSHIYKCQAFNTWYGVVD